MPDLSSQQIERQDYVDNEIFNLINALVPEKYRQMLSNEDGTLAWDIGQISEVRETIQSIIFDSLGLEESKRDEFELEFYPYLAPEADTRRLRTHRDPLTAAPA